jgi:hypothetical protein
MFTFLSYLHRGVEALKLDRGRVFQAVLAAAMVLLGFNTFKPDMTNTITNKVVLLDGADEDSLPIDLIQKPRDYTRADAIAETAYIQAPHSWYASHSVEVKEGLERPLVSRIIRRHINRIDDPAEAAEARKLFEKVGRGEPLRGVETDRLTRFLERIIPILELIEPFVPPPYNVAVSVAVEFLKLILANRLADDVEAIAPCNFPMDDREMPDLAPDDPALFCGADGGIEFIQQPQCTGNGCRPAVTPPEDLSLPQQMAGPGPRVYHAYGERSTWRERLREWRQTRAWR